MSDEILISKNPIEFGRTFRGTRNLISSFPLNLISETSNHFCVNFNFKDAFHSFYYMTTSG